MVRAVNDTFLCALDVCQNACRKKRVIVFRSGGAKIVRNGSSCRIEILDVTCRVHLIPYGCNRGMAMRNNTSTGGAESFDSNGFIALAAGAAFLGAIVAVPNYSEETFKCPVVSMKSCKSRV